ncbi:MAG: sporulation peptidase YabG [Firmicutes bacterium]|nr:sporulation peptidase YabG [Bacillota bacterium]
MAVRKINIGDLVARKSYNCDILFKVTEIINQSGRGTVYILKGVNMRIMVDAPGEDLVLQTDGEVKGFERRNRNAVMKTMGGITGHGRKKAGKRGIKKAFLYRNEKPFGRPGKILHLDGDKDYLEMCMDAYREMGLTVEGKYMPENQQPQEVGKMLKTYLPDILVLTGHDSVNKGRDIHDINNYRNSKYYAAATREARKFEPSYDDLVIFAGACQSHFEAILEAGANYASSPKRVLIHALDPVFVCQKVACTNVDTIVPVQELLSKTITGIEGIGGLQTRGKYREGMPGPDGTMG